MLFYSKRLNLFVNKDCTIHFLHKIDPLKVINGELKSSFIDGKEVLRIFDIHSDPKKITCFTFLEDS